MRPLRNAVGRPVIPYLSRALARSPLVAMISSPITFCTRIVARGLLV